MTSLTATADAIRAEARSLDPLKVLIMIVGLIPFLLGWVARIAWVLISLLWAGAAIGWKTAHGQLEARSPSRGS